MPTYTPDQLARRDASIWTKVQVVLAPIQFLAFLVSFSLVVHYLATGRGYELAQASVLIKIGLLWAITITGMIWEKQVFGHYFLARQFFWEDVGNAVAMLFHNLYFLAQALAWSDRAVMTLMLIAYCSYLINCSQFVVKGIQTGRQRRASRQSAESSPQERTDTRHETRDTRQEMGDRATHPTSHISHPTSRIPHPRLRIKD